MNLFDSSALLAFLQDEPGAQLVEAALDSEPACGAANWAETAQKVSARTDDWSLARGLLLSYGLKVVPVTEVDAERAASLWRRGSALSLGDRLCLAQGDRLDAIVWTADQAWGESASVRQIRLPGIITSAPPTR